ncbi:MAG: T9SS type A sorting domain-containing protein [Bacteroidetes bacterium]|nr:T9SS type A sorting domain-containing protein [Bacteroidota bacterium]
MRKQTIQILLFIFAFLNIQGLNAQNAIYHGSIENDKANSLVEFDEHLYILGTTRKTHKSSTDYYLLQLNLNGSLKNKTVFGGSHGDYGKHLLVNKNGIYILGKTWDGGYPNNDMYLHKLDFGGTKEWSKYYGGEKNDLGHKFIETLDGSFALVGHNRSLDNFGDVYLVKADKEGELIWETHFGDRYIDHGFDVIENKNGEFIVVGTKGGFYNPTSTDYLNHDADIFVIKTNQLGEEIWSKTFGGTSHDWAKGIITAPDGGYYICGSTQSEGAGSFDFFLMKMDEDGNQIWLKTYGGADFDYGESVVLSADNQLLLLGTSASYSNNYKPNHLLVKTDLEGELIWENTFGGDGSDYSSAMIATVDSGCIFTGWTDHGEFGKNDIVLFKIDKNGNTDLLSSLPPQVDSIKQIKVFPNPVENKFSVIIDSKQSSNLALQLYNPQGALVYTDIVVPNIQNSYQPFITSGMYMFNILNNGNVVFRGKLVFK